MNSCSDLRNPQAKEEGTKLNDTRSILVASGSPQDKGKAVLRGLMPVVR